MTARKAVRRYSAMGKRATAGFATALLHQWLGHDLLECSRRPLGQEPLQSHRNTPIDVTLDL
jgi:hypothetical protein